MKRTTMDIATKIWRHARSVALSGFSEIALCAILCLCLAAVGVRADTQTVGGVEWSYDVDAGKVTVTGAEPATGDLTIPATLGGQPVTGIGYAAFRQCSGLTSVTIPDSVERIGDSAFADCTSLESVTLPASVADIADSAFDGCTRLSSYVVADGNAVYSSADGVLFDAAGATLLAYPAGRPGTVYTIPAGVEAIRPTAFRNCTTLATLKVAMGNMAYSSVEGALYNMDGTELRVWPRGKGGGNVVVPPGTLQIGDSVFEDREDLVSVAFPEGLQRIGRNAFRGCRGLTAVELPEGLKRIESVAFCMTGLETVTVPKSVRWIGGAAFASTPLQSATILGGAISGEDGAFVGCRSLETLTLGTRVSAISYWAFANYSFKWAALKTVHAPVSWEGKACPLSGGFFGADFTIVYDNEEDDGEPTEEEEEYEDAWRFQVVDGGAVLGMWSEVGGKVVIPSTLGGCPVTAIADYAFYYGGDVLTSLRIPGSVTNVGSMAFANCNALTALYVPESWEGTDMLDNAWGGAGQPAGCEIVYYDPATVTWQFDVSGGMATITGADPAVGNLEIPAEVDGYPVTAIGAQAFAWCDGLTSVSVPDSVETIHTGAFGWCSALEHVHIGAGVTNMEHWAFISDRALTAIDVAPGNPVLASRDGVVFSKDLETLVLFPVGKGASYAVPAGVVQIGESAFEGCEGLAEVTFPAGLAVIGTAAFSMCKGLTSVVVPEGVTNIEYRAFADCPALASAVLPDSLVHLGEYAFGKYDDWESEFTEELYDTTSVPGVKLVDGWVVYDGYADYPGVLDLSGVRGIADGAFFGGFGIQTVILPDGLRAIGAGTFRACMNLASVTIPDSVASIGDGTFTACGNLTTLSLPDSVMHVGDDVFTDCSRLGTLSVPGNWQGTSKLANAGVPAGCTVVYRDEMLQRVTFDPTGGTCARRSVTCCVGGTYAHFAIPVREGFKFLGWYDAPEGGTRVRVGQVVTDQPERTLWAHWERLSQTVRFNANGGTCTKKSVKCFVGDAYAHFAIPVREGYKFLGWYDAPEGGIRVRVGQVVTDQPERTLWAHWERLRQTVRFDANGGTCAKTSVKCFVGDAYAHFVIPVREGYKFLGWYDAKEGGSRVRVGMTVTADAERTLYAHWQATVAALSITGFSRTSRPAPAARDARPPATECTIRVETVASAVYEVQWTPELGGAWTVLKRWTADADGETTVSVSVPAGEATGFFRVREVAD